MKMNITGKNLNLSDTFKELLDEKFGILSRYLDSIQFIDVMVEKEANNDHTIQLKVGIPKREPVVLKETDRSLHAAVDIIRDKAENVLTNIKEKLKSKH